MPENGEVRTEDGKSQELSDTFAYLDMVRESGKINMFESPRLLQEAFGFSRREAMDVVKLWMKSFDGRAL